MGKAPRRKKQETLPTPEAIFRGMLYLGKLGQLTPERDSSRACMETIEDVLPEFPMNAWLALSQLAGKGAEGLADELHRTIGSFVYAMGTLVTRMAEISRLGPELDSQAATVLKGLDLFITQLKLNVDYLAVVRAVRSEDSLLALDMAFDAAGNPEAAWYLTERYFKLEPEEEAEEATDGLYARLIDSACAAVSVLERLEQRAPRIVREVAKYYDRWPVLRRRSDKGVQQSPAGETLGERYPLNATAVVHSVRRDSLRCYLEPRLVWLLRHGLPDGSGPVARRKEVEDAMALRGCPWFLRLRVAPPAAVKLLVEADLPPLCRDTADQWARELVVPFIMATDAAGLPELTVPALQAIWKQGRVKSEKTFRSRLLDAVRKELPRMLRD